MSKKTTKRHIVEPADEQRRQKHNAHVLREILEAVKDIKEQEEYDDILGNSSYIFDQASRGYISSVKNWHISKEAKRVWEDITDEDIHMYSYHEYVVAKRDINEMTYFGPHKKDIKPLTCKAGKKFRFNQLFIVEHTTPASDIEKAILKVYSETASDEENMEMFKSLLEKIHVTRILRREDAKITKASHRLETSEVINLSNDEILSVSKADINYPALEGETSVESESVSESVSRFAKNSKFSFDGKNYFKMGVFFNKFVEQIIATRPEYTFEDIQSTFATRIFGMSKGCPSLATVDVFANTTRKDLKDRYKMSLPLVANNVVFYTSTQWTRTSFEKLIEIANKFGYTVSNR